MTPGNWKMKQFEDLEKRVTDLANEVNTWIGLEERTIDENRQRITRLEEVNSTFEQSLSGVQDRLYKLENSKTYTRDAIKEMHKRLDIVDTRLSRAQDAIAAHRERLDAIELLGDVGELLPCPHCASTNLRMEADPEPAWIWCNPCQMSGPSGNTPDEAARLWNSLPRKATP